jgi:hypothetical protein
MERKKSCSACALSNSQLSDAYPSIRLENLLDNSFLFYFLFLFDDERILSFVGATETVTRFHGVGDTCKEGKEPLLTIILETGDALTLMTQSIMEQHTFKNVNNCLNTNIYSYLGTSGSQSSNPYLNVVHFFYSRVN